ncbi:MAG TPA: right-handed parallel beta-helix repeat-containing protein [Sedimentisphaerales bacterium]|nr:right-handed parallel beta-helix repeat-containing protein [Sedimentisphaerales bacterium]
MKQSRFPILACGLLLVLPIALTHAADIREQPAVGSSFASVRDFGAVGDGKADDAGAFQRALNSGRGDIFVPRGTYRLGKTIVADLDRIGPVSIVGSGVATIIMAGSGPAIKLVGTHEGSADPSSVKENVWLNQRTPTVSGLEIVGADPQACGIEATGTMQATFSRLTIRKALHGIHLTRRNRNVIIADCHIYENRGIGIYLDHVDLHQINVGNSHVSYNAGGGVVQRGGAVRNLQVGNCDIEANMGANSPATANVLIDATGGSIGEIAITGCTLQHTHEAPGSANVRIIGEGELRAYADGERRGGNVAITGNILSDVQINIHLIKVRGVTIIGNTIWKGYAHDLLIEDSANVVIGSNVLDRNPRYHYGDGATANRGLVFRNCEQVVLSGLNINNVRRKEAAIVLEKCRDFNISGCIILDYDQCGILMDDVRDTVVSSCTVRDSRPQAERAAALVLKKGQDNLVANNLLAGKLDVAAGSAKLTNNLER